LFVVFMCSFRFQQIYCTLVTCTSYQLRPACPTAIIRMYTIRILLPIKWNNWRDIYSRCCTSGYPQQSNSGLLVSVTYTIYTRIYIIFFFIQLHAARTQKILVSLLTFPEHVLQDDLVVFFSNTLLSAASDLCII